MRLTQGFWTHIIAVKVLANMYINVKLTKKTL